MDSINVDAQPCCIQTIARRKDWLVRIGRRFINLNNLRNEILWDGRKIDLEQIATIMLICPTAHAAERNLYNIIEKDPIRNYDYIEQELVKTQLLVPKMAIYLTGRTCDIICEKVFSKQNIDETFVKLFFIFFFPLYLIRFYSWTCIHMMVKASKAYPDHFKVTIITLLRYRITSPNSLQDYVEHLNDKESTKLIKYISEYQLTPEEFKNHLPVIYLLYKKCEKNDNIFNYILHYLDLYNLLCMYDKNYGRLLLYFVQNLSGFNVRIRLLKKLIENHHTSFKSPCMAILEKFVTEIIALQMNFQDGPQIVIPRPEERFQL